MRVHILGASGSGTTTLGAALGVQLGCPHLDADDYYWLPSDPPFANKRPVGDRVRLLEAAVADATAWVLSGSLMGWGDPLIPLFDMVVFLKIPTGLRLARLRAREAWRYGEEAVAPGGGRYRESQAFLEWAAGYDEEGFSGRSLTRHEAWLAHVGCPVVRIEGDLTTLARIDRVTQALREL